MKAVIAIALALTIAGKVDTPRTGVRPGSDPLIVHVLNRIGFGPRPGDVMKVRAMGVERYIDEQLRPGRIADPELAARLSGLSSVTLTSRDIVERYEVPRLEAKRQKKQAAADLQPGDQPKPSDPMQQRANSVILELSEQKILRAVYSDRQLDEVLTDFWFNHFNVDARKGRDRFLLTEYERDAIRPHVLGTFRELLGATAKSPAMLFYLDNWMSASQASSGTDLGRPLRRGPSPLSLRQSPPQGKKAPKWLNENYGRELMELHTLGVDGGYTQKDVTEVARAFTGWTIQNPRQGGGFVFNPRFHDTGEKVVLGHAIKAGGAESDGEQVLDILAKHPSTAHFIVTKLVRRFVGDTPAPALVDRAAARFQSTDGDVREVMRTILTSKEFLSPEAYGAKVKTPFEFVASAIRALGADVQNAMPLVRQVQQLGMPLYQCQPPTGYKDTADAWVNTGALVGRMNFASMLTEGHVRGVLVASAEPNAMTLGGPDFQRK